MSTELQLEPAAHPAALNAAISKVRFAWILPLGAFLLSALLLWPERMFILWQFGIHLPPWFEQIFSIQLWPRNYGLSTSGVSALNLPADLLLIPFAIFSADHMVPHPAALLPAYWNAIICPPLCVPFWWISGRAIDALITLKNGQLMPRIGWVQTVVGFLLMVIGTVGFIGVPIGIFFFSTADDKKEIATFMRVVAGCGLWAMLGGLSVIASFRQRRLRKKML
jgi:hypothetical protein